MKGTGLTGDDVHPARTEGQSESSTASGWQNAFGRPWIKRVGELDDGTLHALVDLLHHLRRVKYLVTAVGFGAGALFLGLLPIEKPLYALLFYATAGMTFALPTLAATSLAVRRVFLRECRKLGVKKSTALLLMTRAERASRHLPPLASKERRLGVMAEAVRNWDRAED